ncbi:hypothetical protein PVK06_042456 [Gossypium arboreum]|uniref:Uncharacterized protein n=1 Tax=Gossypium arboreum TaxID=29729 RepID=A0ABR0MLD6_GOSAR|nr:hypothetical protein PVK06_042456 [Gossypium arboreum]
MKTVNKLVKDKKTGMVFEWSCMHVAKPEQIMFNLLLNNIGCYLNLSLSPLALRVLDSYHMMFGFDSAGR